MTYRSIDYTGLSAAEAEAEMREFVAEDQARAEAEYELELIASGAEPNVIAAKLSRRRAEHVELREQAIERTRAMLALRNGATLQ